MVVQANGAERVYEAHVDASLRDGLVFGIDAGGFVNDDVAHHAGRQDSFGTDDIEGAGLIEAVEGIDAGDPGEDAAFFFLGKQGNIGGSDSGFDESTPFDGLNLSTLLRVHDTGELRWRSALCCVECPDHSTKIPGGRVGGNFGEGFLSEGLGWGWSDVVWEMSFRLIGTLQVPLLDEGVLPGRW